MAVVEGPAALAFCAFLLGRLGFGAEIDLPEWVGLAFGLISAAADTAGGAGVGVGVSAAGGLGDCGGACAGAEAGVGRSRSSVGESKASAIESSISLRLNAIGDEPWAEAEGAGDEPGIETGWGMDPSGWVVKIAVGSFGFFLPCGRSGVIPCSDRRCFVNASDRVKVLLQPEQRIVSTVETSLREEGLGWHNRYKELDLPASGHVYGRSPVCARQCVMSEWRVACFCPFRGHDSQ